MSDELRDVIGAALTELAGPAEQDNPGDVEAAEVDVDGVTFDGSELDEEDSDDEAEGVEPEDDVEAETDTDESDESDEEDEEPVDDNPVLEETFTVKVDGEEVEVTVREALEGYQRREDYTRKTQELAEARKAFEGEIQEYAEVFENVTAFEEAWEENPTGVLARLTAGTDNPTHALVLTIKELAVAGELEKGFLDTFGIDDDLIKEWSRDVELNSLRGQVNKSKAASESERADVEHQRSVQEAIAAYEQAIDDIIDDEGLQLDATGREAFKREVAGYAAANNLTNLKAARKAMLFDESQKKQAVAVKTRERAKQKKQTSAVTRKGSTGAGSPVGNDPSDLRSVIESTMRELSS
jgi:hypothetical protein